MRLLLLVGLLPFACRSEARKDREAFDCMQTGAMIRCLEMRYQWPTDRAVLRYADWLVEKR
jgi:hypothetical protein